MVSRAIGYIFKGIKCNLQSRKRILTILNALKREEFVQRCYGRYWLAKKFARVFPLQLTKNPSELFSQSNITEEVRIDLIHKG